MVKEMLKEKKKFIYWNENNLILTYMHIRIYKY